MSHVERRTTRTAHPLSLLVLVALALFAASCGGSSHRSGEYAANANTGGVVSPAPPAAARIEELVNYFPYDSPQPAGPAPFSVTAEVAECPWDARHRLVHIGLQ